VIQRRYLAKMSSCFFVQCYFRHLNIHSMDKYSSWKHSSKYFHLCSVN